jgi:hypothetical protein
MSTTTIEDAEVLSFQGREKHYTLSAKDKATGHKVVMRIAHGDLDGKALEPMVAARLRQLEEEAGIAHRHIIASLRKARGQLNNTTLEQHDVGAVDFTAPYTNAPATG